MCVCVFFPFILDVRLVERTSRSHTGWRSHMFPFPPSFCGACLNFSREKDSAVPFPRRPWSRILCANDLVVFHLLGILVLFLFWCVEKSQLPGFELTSQRVRLFRGYQLSMCLLKPTIMINHQKKDKTLSHLSVLTVIGSRMGTSSAVCGSRGVQPGWLLLRRTSVQIPVKETVFSSQRCCAC